MTCEFVESEDDIGDFNSHAHVERDNCFYFTYIENGNFNSHAHVERDNLNRGILNP